MWLPADIGRVRPALRPVLPSLLGTLQRHGLAARGDSLIDPFGRTARTMQQRWISDVAEKLPTAAGGLSPVRGNVDFYAPADSWLPTELGEEVLNVLFEAGAEFDG
jgi:hypothetical protein